MHTLLALTLAGSLFTAVVPGEIPGPLHAAAGIRSAAPAPRGGPRPGNVAHGNASLPSRPTATPTSHALRATPRTDPRTTSALRGSEPASALPNTRQPAFGMAPTTGQRARPSSSDGEERPAGARRSRERVFGGESDHAQMQRIFDSPAATSHESAHRESSEEHPRRTELSEERARELHQEDHQIRREEHVDAEHDRHVGSLERRELDKRDSAERRQIEEERHSERHRLADTRAADGSRTGAAAADAREESARRHHKTSHPGGLGSYFVHTEDAPSISDDGRRHVAVFVVYAGLPAVDVAQRAAMAELEKAKVAHDHADVSVRVYAGRRNARESWKQAPDPQGGFLFLEYRDRGATIERQSPSFVN